MKTVTRKEYPSLYKIIELYVFSIKHPWDVIRDNFSLEDSEDLSHLENLFSRLKTDYESFDDKEFTIWYKKKFRSDLTYSHLGDSEFNVFLIIGSDGLQFLTEKYNLEDGQKFILELHNGKYSSSSFYYKNLVIRM